MPTPYPLTQCTHQPPPPGLAPRLGQPRHRRGDRGDLSAPAVLPHARPRRERRSRSASSKARPRRSTASSRSSPAAWRIGRRRSGRSCCSGTASPSIARPFIAIATTWPQVFAVRVLDRVGKGIRGAPRDAMLAGMGDADDAREGVRVSIAGWIISARWSARCSRRLFLFFYPDHYRTLFALTIIPGAIAVALDLLRPGVGTTSSGPPMPA